MRISKRFTIEAAHRLPRVPVGHKCARLHGHSFRIEIEIEAPLQKDSGWVMDFADIAAAFKPLHERLDHHYLNEIEGLDNPTSEHLAIWIWERLIDTLPDLARVIIEETCTVRCIYAGEQKYQEI